MEGKISLPPEDEATTLPRTKHPSPEFEKSILPVRQTSVKIVKCRKRFKTRKFYRGLIESSSLCGQTDERPFANILISNENFFGLLDSGAGISALGRNCLNFIERNNITLQPFRASISTADGSKNSIAGYCNLPVSYKGVTKNITFYAVPSLCQEVYLGLDFWQKFAIAPNIIPPIETIDLEQPAKSKDLCFHELSAEKKLHLN